MLDEEQMAHFRVRSEASAAGAGSSVAYQPAAAWLNTSRDRYDNRYGLTPGDAPQFQRMTQGWFTGLPDHRPHRALAFGDAAEPRRSARLGREVAEVPLRPRRRIVVHANHATTELSCQSTSRRRRGSAFLVLLTAELTGTNIGAYSDAFYQLSIYVIRVEQGDGSGGHTLTTRSPRESVARYLLKSVNERVAEGVQSSRMLPDSFPVVNPSRG